MDLNTYLESLPTGGRAKLARTIGIASTYLYQIARGIRPVPPDRCISIEQATGGAVTRHDLRPDIFGELTDRDRPTADARVSTDAGNPIPDSTAGGDDPTGREAA